MLTYDFTYLPVLFVAIVVFGWALLWVIMQWLRADDAAARFGVELDAPRAAAPTPAAAPAADEIDEGALLRTLGWSTVSCMVLAMVVGAVWAQVYGVLVGAFIGPVVGAGFGVALDIVLQGRRKAARAPAAQTAAADEAAAHS